MGRALAPTARWRPTAPVVVLMIGCSRERRRPMGVVNVVGSQPGHLSGSLLAPQRRRGPMPPPPPSPAPGAGAEPDRPRRPGGRRQYLVVRNSGSSAGWRSIDSVDGAGGVETPVAAVDLGSGP